MIVCPECDHLNSEKNKFCEKCGTSLTEKSCPQCGEKVSFEAEHCPNCHTVTGTILWAVVSQYQKIEESPQVSAEIEEIFSPQPVVIEDDFDQKTVIQLDSEEDFADTELYPTPEISATEATIEITHEKITTETISEKPIVPEEQSQEKSVFSPEYLDSEKRYRLKIENPTEGWKMIPLCSHPLEKLFQGRVLDCRPLERSRLQYGIEALDNSEEPLSTKSGIPAIALPYLALVEDFDTSIPPLQDAWQDEDKCVVLLSDRSELPLFSDLWAEQEIKFFQLIYYFDEMAALFKELSNWRCCHSLLLEENLRIDEEENFCLVQLYPDAPTNQPQLQDLGKSWQKLLIKSELQADSPLKKIIQELINNQIKTVKELRFRLQSLANEQHQALIEQSSNVTVSSLDNPEDGTQSSVPEDAEELPTIVLPVRLLALSDAALTDIGNQRDHNEDYFAIQTQAKKEDSPQGTKYIARGLYIICDGMGGHAAGEVASAMATEILRKYFSNNWGDELPSHEVIKKGILQANDTIYSENIKNGSSGSARMGTTLAMLLVQDTKAVIAHVGDSRIYGVTRKGGIQQITLDHAVGQQSILQGLPPELAYSRADAYQLTQALGPRDNNYVEPEIQFINIKEDTLFLICSDGLCDNDLIETHGENFLPPLLSTRANLDVELQKLIDIANDHNGHDNITAIVVRIKVQAHFEPRPPQV